MSLTNSGTKRGSLRFNVRSYSLRYKTEFDDGGGEVVNISTGGCALKNVDVPLSLHEKVLLLLPLDEGGKELEIGATVIRVEEDSLALQFSNISEESKQQIVKLFAGMQRERMQ